MEFLLTTCSPLKRCEFPPRDLRRGTSVREQKVRHFHLWRHLQHQEVEMVRRLPFRRRLLLPQKMGRVGLEVVATVVEHELPALGMKTSRAPGPLSPKRARNNYEWAMEME
ncbi:unnamed protein product [Amoebophrya sp. A120]|nr:unnamed protein product [Amoebophrya sp. A120]|eukprot:GSA120T00006931001.1